MTLRKFIIESLRFHARSHLGVLLGAAVGSTVLVGALVVGDSVRGSLRDFALARLGKVQWAMASGDRLFRAELAKDLGSELPEGEVQTAAAFQLRGTATRADGQARANQLQVVGVDSAFWQLADRAPSFETPGPEELVVNQRLADQLRVSKGDTLIVRVPRPTQLSRDAPITPQEDTSVALRVQVSAIAADAEFGRFSLRANQVAPFNAFVSLAWLQERLEQPGKANLLVIGRSPGSTVDLEQIRTAFDQTWQLSDVQLELRELPEQDRIELRTPRVFLDSASVRAATHANPESTEILTYFVNELKSGERSTPYSMVTAMNEPVVPEEMTEDEVLINQWLADDLQVEPGDTLQLRYYVMGSMRKLEQRTHQFTIRGVLPMELPAADPELMPKFPGLADVDNCRNWDAGFPIDTGAIRDKDQDYWDTYRGAPKAFVTLQAGQEMWRNRYGELTAVRYSGGEQTLAAIRDEIRNNLDPASLGLQFLPVREQALTASSQSQDFGGLFIGFSLFLIVAALLLMALMFQFGLEQRTTEVGTLLAVGFRPKQVRRIWLTEGLMLAVIGGAIGVIGGIGYAKAMVYGLSTIWQEAVNTSALSYHAQPFTLVIGAVAGVIVAWATIWLAIRRQADRPARELLAEGGEESAWKVQDTQWRSRRSHWIGGISGIGAMALLIYAAFQTNAPGAFFGAGALLLIAGLSLSSVFLGRLSRSTGAGQVSLGGMGFRNATRRRKRSLATLGLLACGSFLVIAVGAFRLDANRNAASRDSGTGGFALIGQSALPVVHDLNNREGQQFFGLDPETMNEIRLVQIRVREGDDASCLNLNRAQTPRLLGVDPEELSRRGAFTFAGMAAGYEAEQPWELLNEADTEPGVVPAIADQASIQWALGKSLGDTLSYTDEQGREFQVKLVAGLANSILQGNIIISEEAFTRRYPSQSGYQMFLIDAPEQRVQEVSETLTRMLEDVGLGLTPAPRRLAEFNAVQNTYLSTFQVLGGLGLLLGSVGLGVVVLRNVMERRGELALLLAVGFRRRSLKWYVMSEHGALLLLGLLVGTLAALLAVLPTLLAPGSDLPYQSLGLTLGAVLLSGLIWTWLATLVALRGSLLDALRNN